jgi:uncharacterized membrane protein YgcG
VIQDDATTRVTGNLKRKRYWSVAGAIVLAIAGAAIAASAGKYYCPDCTFDGAFAFSETDMFIRSEVNQYVGSWIDSKGDPKEVTICNGSECATFQYIKLSSTFLLKKREASNWQADNGGGGGDGGGGGGNDGGGGGAIDPGKGNLGGGPPICNGPCSGTVTVGG